MNKQGMTQIMFQRFRSSSSYSERETATLSSVGIATKGNLAVAQRIITEEIKRMLHVYGGSEPGISPRLRQVLEAAWREMEQFHDGYLSVEHLLLALFDVSDEGSS